MPSAICFNLDQSKILLSGNRLNSSQHNILLSHWLLSLISNIKSLDRYGRGMNPIAMTCHSLERILAEWGIKPATSCSQILYATVLRRTKNSISVISQVSPVLGWGSEVSCPRTLPRKNPVDPVRHEPRTLGLRVKYFTTEPCRTHPPPPPPPP